MKDLRFGQLDRGNSVRVEAGTHMADLVAALLERQTRLLIKVTIKSSPHNHGLHQLNETLLNQVNKRVLLIWVEVQIAFGGDAY